MTTQEIKRGGVLKPRGRLIITVGLPGSGKTTWADQRVAADETSNTIRISRDDIRRELFGKYVLNREQENQVTALQHAVVEELLLKGRRVIVDDTNLHKLTRDAWLELGRRASVRVSFKPFRANVDECIRRCEDRFEKNGDRLVPASVINEMARRHPGALVSS